MELPGSGYHHALNAIITQYYLGVMATITYQQFHAHVIINVTQCMGKAQQYHCNREDTTTNV